ncbi:MAG TPA: universal stress protein [Actinoplanes sp.]|nr:universal stress protein [Actinoplanes sp.]
MTVRGVVVGVDGSPDADDALRWALTEGRRRNLPVRAVNVWHPSGRPSEVEWLSTLRSVADLREHLLDDVASGVRAVAEQAGATDVPLTPEVLYGHPTQELIRAAGEDSLLVVGSRGRGSVAGLMRGSVSQSCAQYAAGTVVIVRGRRTDPAAGHVVAGIDGSAESIRALRFAAEAARHREVPLRVIHAWTMPYLGFAGPATRLPQDAVDDLTEQAQRILQDSIDQASLDVRQTDLEARLVQGPPAPSLLQAADGADLLVVGSRGLGGWKGLLLGSVSTQCVTESPCPVAVVRAAGG